MGSNPTGRATDDRFYGSFECSRDPLVGTILPVVSNLYNKEIPSFDSDNTEE